MSLGLGKGFRRIRAGWIKHGQQTQELPIFAILAPGHSQRAVALGRQFIDHLQCSGFSRLVNDTALDNDLGGALGHLKNPVAVFEGGLGVLANGIERSEFDEIIGLEGVLICQPVNHRQVNGVPVLFL